MQSVDADRVRLGVADSLVCLRDHRTIIDLIVSFGIVMRRVRSSPGPAGRLRLVKAESSDWRAASWVPVAVSLGFATLTAVMVVSAQVRRASAPPKQFQTLMRHVPGLDKTVEP